MQQMLLAQGNFFVVVPNYPVRDFLYLHMGAYPPQIDPLGVWASGGQFGGGAVIDKPWGLPPRLFWKIGMGA